MSTTESSPPAAESIAGNEDLLTELLSHLPARSLIRFKCVSNQWLNLISGRRFSHLHSRLHRNPTCSALSFFHPSRETPGVLHIHPPYPSWSEFVPLRADGNRSSPPPFFSDLESNNLKILESCNGLMLLGLLVPTSEFSYFVCNPTTNQIFKLPVPNEIADGSISVACVSLAFDPERCEGYKVICIWILNSNNNQHGIDVYSPRTGQWKRAVDCNPEPLLFDCKFERGVYCDGKIHWLIRRENSMFFDLESERMRFLPLPPSVGFDQIIYFGESMGHLHLIEYETNTLFEFNVMELNTETFIWFVKYEFYLHDLRRRFYDDIVRHFHNRGGDPFDFYLFSILAVVRAENEDDTNLILSIPGKVIKYNFKTGSSNLLLRVRNEPDGFATLKTFNAFQFIESLYQICRIKIPHPGNLTTISLFVLVYNKTHFCIL